MQISDAGGSYGAVFVDLDMVSQSLAQLARNLDELPHEAEVARHDGPFVGVALEFYMALSRTTQAAGKAAAEMRLCLTEADESIRAAVAALTATDADAQASADKVLHALDANTAAATGGTAAGGTPLSASTAGEGGAERG